jgi:ABC transporter
VGAWQPTRGSVRIDGVVLDHGSVESLSSHIGYLPQDVELSAGTVAENIIAAARAAGVHDMIVCLAESYETRIGEGGAVLSAGQRQGGVGSCPLWRSLPGPCWTSRTPTSMPRAKQRWRRRSSRSGHAVASVSVIAHPPAALAALDQLLVLRPARFEPSDPGTRC